MMRRIARILSFFCLVLLAGVAEAQDNTAEEADLAFELGIEEYRGGDYRAALVHLLKSNRLAPNKNVVFNIAGCYEALGRFDNAYQRYTDYVAMEDDPDERLAGQRALERIAPRVALIRVESVPPGATIFVGRRDLGRRGHTPRTLAVPPGKTHILLELAGYASASDTVTATTGETATLKLPLEQLLGEVMVAGSPEGARISVEGQDIEAELPTSLQLPPGQHLIEVTADGYTTVRELVTVNLLVPARVEATLAPLTGKIVVDASERGALIEIDGEAMGFAPAVVEVPIGLHKVRITAQGFTDHVEEVPLEADDVVNLDIKLARATLLGATVTTATKSAITARRTPAVVAVVDHTEIQARGYRSVAEVLRSIPGFYDIYDMSTHNFGIRGVSGGARSSGSLVKLMIDGQPVPYRPSTGNFFGPELIPMSAVERIEVIRGPASALYGANAFLGVVNVITRTSGGSSATAQVGSVANHLAWGTEVTVQGGSEDDAVEGMAAAHYSDTDRSGLFVGPTSPLLDRTDNPLDERGRSTNDRARPESLLARLAVGHPDEGTGRFTVFGTQQRLDTRAEFRDYEPLSHRSRVELDNRAVRLGWERAFVDDVTIQAHLAWFESGPGENDRVNLGRTDQELRRKVNVTGQEAGLEVSVEPRDDLRGLVGVDLTIENHNLQSFDTLILEDVFDANGNPVRDRGTILPGAGRGRTRTLENEGIFAQGTVDLSSAFSATGGLRLDVHNIYGVPCFTRTQRQRARRQDLTCAPLSPRAGLVLAPEDTPWSGKLLYGSSFKAPSAEQLYTRSMIPADNDILGNSELDPQFARTVELAGGYASERYGEIAGNVFFTRVEGLVEYLELGNIRQAQNALDTEDIVGAESTTRLALAPWLTGQLGIGLASVVSQTVNAEQQRVFNVDQIPTSFPTYQVHALTELRLPAADVRLAPEVSFVGPRAASQSNTVAAGKAYEIPSYVMLSASLSAPALYLVSSAHPTSFSARATDILGTQRPEPGFNGFDYPALGPRAQVTVKQAF